VRRRAYGTIAIAVIGLGIALSMSTQTSGERTAKSYAQEFGGSPDSYSTILHELSCGRLLEIHDLASRRRDRTTPGSPEQRTQLGVVTAAEDRLAIVGCPTPVATPTGSA